jgi:hypothetical protein
LEGRWANLTLSALYDGAIDLHDITKEDPESLLREALIHKEAARRRSFEFLGLQSQVVSGSSLDTDSRNEFLRGILEKGQGKQPGGKVEPSPTSEMDDYAAYYDRVTGQTDVEDKARE